MAQSQVTLSLHLLPFAVRAKPLGPLGPFVDKAGSGGHNEKASLDL